MLFDGAAAIVHAHCSFSYSSLSHSSSWRLHLPPSPRRSADITQIILSHAQLTPLASLFPRLLRSLPPSLGSPTRAPRERSRCCAAVAAPSLSQSRFRSPAPAFAAFLASFLPPLFRALPALSSQPATTELRHRLRRPDTESGLQSPVTSSSSSNLQMG